jgi:hypothetical protein
MMTLKITAEVEELNEVVKGIVFESDGFDGDEYVSVAIGNQMVVVERKHLKRIVSAL